MRLMTKVPNAEVSDPESYLSGRHNNRRCHKKTGACNKKITIIHLQYLFCSNPLHCNEQSKTTAMKKTGYLAMLLCCFYFTQAQPNPNDSIPKEVKSVTKHAVVIDGKTISYTATAGALILKNDKRRARSLL
jgi:hypothetical protein